MLLRRNVCNHMIVSDGINRITYQVFTYSAVCKALVYVLQLWLQGGPKPMYKL